MTAAILSSMLTTDRRFGAQSMTAPLREVLVKRPGPAFSAAFDTLTAQCNNCHEATNFGFNRVQRPATNPYPNQVFEPIRRP